MFERWFELSAHGTTARREILAGLTTFLTMAYIMFVNPVILAGAGMDQGAVFTATCLATAATTIFMGLYAKLPVALAPGMGLNAYFAYTVVPGFNYDWQLALGCVFLSGILFVLISITPAREWLINAIPRSLKLAIAAGIGFFLAFIGLVNAGIVTVSSLTLVKQGVLTDPRVLLATAGFLVIVALAARRVTGAVLIGILVVTIAAVGFGYQQAPGAVSLPPSILPTLFAMHFGGPAGSAVATSVLVFLLIDMLDTSGTLTAVAYEGKLLDENGRLPNARRALTVDAAGTMLGAAIGTSPMTAYIESTAGIQAGAKTGLAAVTVGVLFLLSLFLSPLASAVPIYATAPALIFVAALMVKGLTEIDWDDLTEAAPALLTALAIPFTYSIAEGMGIGFIAYVTVKFVSGRWRDINFAVFIIAAAFAARIATQ
ncbi:MAG: NCS2 family permease [Alphaproteobacteria bacterium]|nr:NCS2 family permease [Alphaproteobacteria bacterium]